jgi:hypothetical protein
MICNSRHPSRCVGSAPGNHYGARCAGTPAVVRGADLDGCLSLDELVHGVLQDPCGSRALRCLLVSTLNLDETFRALYLVALLSGVGEPSALSRAPSGRNTKSRMMASNRMPARGRRTGAWRVL